MNCKSRQVFTTFALGLCFSVLKLDKVYADAGQPFPPSCPVVSIDTSSTDSVLRDVEQQNINKKTVIKFFDQLARGEAKAAFDIVDNNATWWFAGDIPEMSGPHSKLDYLLKVGAPIARHLGVLNVKVTSAIADGNAVAAEAVSIGKAKSIDGEDIEYHGVYHFLIVFNKEGKFSCIKEYVDTNRVVELRKKLSI